MHALDISVVVPKNVFFAAVVIVIVAVVVVVVFKCFVLYF